MEGSGNLSTMDVGKVVITELNGTNYLAWAAQLEAFLQARGFWEYVEEEVTAPEPGNESYAGDSKTKSTERAEVLCSVESEYVPMILSERDPKRMWDKSSDAHKSKCTASVHTLRNRLLDIRTSQGFTIRAYVN